MQNRMDDQVYAGLFVRLAAYLIDCLIVGAVLLVVRIPLWILSLSHPDAWLVRNFIFKYSISDIVLYALKVTYFIVLTYRSGATVGKKVFHLRVVSSDGNDLTLFQIFYRETIGRFLSSVIFCLGYLLIIVDKEKCSLHDLLADTRVIYYHERKVYAHSDIHYKNMIYQGDMSRQTGARPMDAPKPQPQYQQMAAGQQEQPIYQQQMAAGQPEQPTYRQMAAGQQEKVVQEYDTSHSEYQLPKSAMGQQPEKNENQE